MSYKSKCIREIQRSILRKKEFWACFTLPTPNLIGSRAEQKSIAKVEAHKFYQENQLRKP